MCTAYDSYFHFLLCDAGRLKPHRRFFPPLEPGFSFLRKKFGTVVSAPKSSEFTKFGVSLMAPETEPEAEVQGSNPSQQIEEVPMVAANLVEEKMVPANREEIRLARRKRRERELSKLVWSVAEQTEKPTSTEKARPKIRPIMKAIAPVKTKKVARSLGRPPLSNGPNRAHQKRRGARIRPCPPRKIRVRSPSSQRVAEALIDLRNLRVHKKVVTCRICGEGGRYARCPGCKHVVHQVCLDQVVSQLTFDVRVSFLRLRLSAKSGRQSEDNST